MCARSEETNGSRRGVDQRGDARAAQCTLASLKAYRLSPLLMTCCMHPAQSVCAHGSTCRCEKSASPSSVQSSLSAQFAHSIRKAAETDSLDGTISASRCVACMPTDVDASHSSLLGTCGSPLQRSSVPRPLSALNCSYVCVGLNANDRVDCCSSVGGTTVHSGPSISATLRGRATRTGDATNNHHTRTRRKETRSKRTGSAQMRGSHVKAAGKKGDASMRSSASALACRL
jgi:hypothetical protein